MAARRSAGERRLVGGLVIGEARLEHRGRPFARRIPRQAQRLRQRPTDQRIAQRHQHQRQRVVVDRLRAAAGTIIMASPEFQRLLKDAGLLATDFDIDSYTTLDLRAGITSDDDRWRLSIYGQNVTNKSYVTAISTFLDTLVRYRGKPAIYGLSVSYKY